jgi:hypothetical protein
MLKFFREKYFFPKTYAILPSIKGSAARTETLRNFPRLKSPPASLGEAWPGLPPNLGLPVQTGIVGNLAEGIMRKSWSTFLLFAVLGWLPSPGAAPAWAYYPPLAATASSTARSVTRQVIDPELSQNPISFTSYFFFGDQEVMSLKQQNGVIAWVLRSGSNYYVTCCVYDPVLGTPNPGMFTSPFQEDTRGPFTSVDQLQAADGVVAYVAGIPPSTGDPSGHFEFRYATYDPAKQAWQMRPWSYGQIHGMSLATKDSVVVFLFVDYLGYQWLMADIYDPQQGMWGFGGAMGVTLPKGILGLTINNATVSYLTPELSDTWGYTMGHGWGAGKTTPPQPYFVARPTSTPRYRYVWFTDMSIGASSWGWNFGDGASSTSRSPHHYYDAGGVYTVQQSVNSGAASYASTIKVKGAGVGFLVPLLLNN